MASYNYDESGNMATYYLLSFLALILIPFTLASFSLPKSKALTDGCQCTLCIEQRLRISKREKGSMFRMTRRFVVLLLGWTLFAFLAYHVANKKIENKLYDPFEILDIKSSATEKEIKSHYKKLSKKFHPDKIKLAINETMEEVQEHFVQITKAYKALTDETIRLNWQLYNNPDGPQQTTMGIAIPKWIIEGKNNIWVLGFYGLLFGFGLPTMVGRWWFGNRQRTKDGIHNKSAAAFFKSLTEDSDVQDIIPIIARAYEWEIPNAKSTHALEELVSQVQEKLPANASLGTGNPHKAATLIYAHLYRIPVTDKVLQQDQIRVLTVTSVLLKALTVIASTRGWLKPTLAILHLKACLTQAVAPADVAKELIQFPDVTAEDAVGTPGITGLVHKLEEVGDSRAEIVKKAAERWGSLDLVDVNFRVIGERRVTPSCIIFVIVKLRIVPPLSPLPEPKELDVEETKKRVVMNNEKDEAFLTSKGESEPLNWLSEDDKCHGWAHAPYWPTTRKPTWWIVLADTRLNKVIVPPIKVTDVPFASPEAEGGRDYRSYKFQYQAPSKPGLCFWKVFIISDTFVMPDVTRDVTVTVEELGAEEDYEEDEISDPDEDSFAGQMAMMKGGKVKHHRDSDEEGGSSTDDGSSASDSESSSDSESD